MIFMRKIEKVKGLPFSIHNAIVLIDLFIIYYRFHIMMIVIL